MLQVEHVSKTFPGNKALKDVSFDVPKGEIRALLGENGCGKSTMIKILSGFHEPDAGSRVTVNDDELRFGAPNESARLGLRFVHQNLGVVDQLSAVENAALAAGQRRHSAMPVDLRTQAQRLSVLLDQLDVEVDLWRPLGECRAVDRTVIAIARAIEGLDLTSGVLVLDEPTAALPRHEVNRLFEVIRGLVSRGVTTIYVSHRLDEVFALAHSVTVLRDGRVQGSGRIEDLGREDVFRMITGGGESQYADQRESPPTINKQGARLAVTGLSSDVLHDLDISVAPGEILGVAGVLGSGREEVAYAIVGATKSSARDVQLEGRSVGRLTPKSARRARIALVPGDRRTGSAVREFDVRENLTFANLKANSRHGFLVRGKELETATRWINEFALRPSDPAKSFALLSGGNQQKVVLGKWFDIDPVVVLLDEPTGGVDVGARQAIYQIVRQRAALGVSFIVCSSDHEDLVELCDRVLVLRDGRAKDELVGSQIGRDRILAAMTGRAL